MTDGGSLASVVIPPTPRKPPANTQLETAGGRYPTHAAETLYSIFS